MSAAEWRDRRVDHAASIARDPRRAPRGRDGGGRRPAAPRAGPRPTSSSTRSASSLGRDPNDLELAMFSVMWSEHCSYKSSRPLLRDAADRRRATSSPGPGENAGVISIGDGLAVAFKIESHNHPTRGRAVPGRRDRRRRDPARHLRDGRPADRGPRRPPVRRPGRRPDAPPRRRRRARRRRLRQLRRRADGRRRARVRPLVPGQPAGQRDGDRAARGAAC